uniref:Uncharacterized protein n=1 Tax=Rhizophora mucronata TaxID=61149 RepID=A0A2P2PFJ2_RHIMU
MPSSTYYNPKEHLKGNN